MLDTEAVTAWISTHPAIIGTGCIILALHFLIQLLQPKKDDSIHPLIPVETTLRAALEEGYRKYPDAPFRLPSAAHPTLVIPIKFLDEIKNMPLSKMSFLEEFRDRYYGHYTDFASNHEGDIVTNSVKVDLTQSLARALDNMQEETGMAYAADMPRTKDWTTMTLYGTVLRMVAKVSGRVMVGAPLCRNEDWIKSSLTYTRDTFLAGRAIWAVSPIWRPFFCLYSKELKAVKQHYQNAAKFLKPIFDQRFEEMKQEGFEKPFDMIQWMIDNSGQDAYNYIMQGRCQLLIAFAALHTTSGLLSNIILDLAARPQYISALREEFEAIIPDGEQITKQKLTKLKKMDSIIKEVQRVNPMNLVTMHRKMMDTVTLSDGTVLPKGSHIGMASGAVASDPALFPNPEEFDGFRFEKMRHTPATENKYQFVTTGKDSLAFGHGPHACPGRFFASNEIKVMLIEFLRRYDVRLLEGQVRPPNIESDMSWVVDPTAQVQVRERALV